MFRKIKILALFIFLCLTAAAKPAKRGPILLHQPDGTSFYAFVKGDEFNKILVSEDGCALARSGDGFYNYALYDAAGIKHNSGHPYGKAVPNNIIAASKHIPYGVLSENAKERRYSFEMTKMSTKASAGMEMKSIIIPAQFSNLHFRYGEAEFTAFVNEVHRYFSDQFGDAGKFEFIIAPVVTLANSYAYYGANDSDGDDINAAQAVAEACTLSDNAVNFAEYDNDGDGFVDNVYIIYAGPDEAEGAGDDYLWSHSWDVSIAGISISLDGVKIGRYAASSELMQAGGTYNNFSGIGSFCHEFSHVLGLPDLYDTDYEQSGGQTEGVWATTSLMDFGLYNNDQNTPPSYNAIEREILGIADVKPLGIGEYHLAPIGSGGEVLRLDTDNPDEYYLFECRQNSGWDKFIGGSGLLVYHIDKSSDDAGFSSFYKINLTSKDRWKKNEVNCNPQHMCAKIIAAAEPFSSTDISGIFFPGANGKYSSMKPFDSSALSLGNIIKNSSGGVSFSVSGSLYIDNVDVYQDAAILGWHLENNLDNPFSKLSISASGAQPQSYMVASSGDNTYAYTAEGLKPDTEYTFSVSVPDGGFGEHIYESTFTTAKVYDGSYPFIYLNRADRYISGAFKKGARIPLRLYNPSQVSLVDWTFDGKRISVDPATGYYSLEKSGRLVAEIKYKDGTSELMIKDVIVK